MIDHPRTFVLGCLLGTGLLSLTMRLHATGLVATQALASPTTSSLTEVPSAAARWLNPYAGRADARRAGDKLFHVIAPNAMVRIRQGASARRACARQPCSQRIPARCFGF